MGRERIDAILVYERSGFVAVPWNLSCSASFGCAANARQRLRASTGGLVDGEVLCMGTECTSSGPPDAGLSVFHEPRAARLVVRRCFLSEDQRRLSICA